MKYTFFFVLLLVNSVKVFPQVNLQYDSLFYNEAIEMKSSDLGSSNQYFRAIIIVEEIYYTLYVDIMQASESEYTKVIKRLKLPEKIFNEVGIEEPDRSIYSLLKWISHDKLLIEIDNKKYVLHCADDISKIFFSKDEESKN